MVATRVLAGAVRAAVKAWSAPGGLELNIQAEGHQSNAVTTVLTNDIDMPTLRRLPKSKQVLCSAYRWQALKAAHLELGTWGISTHRCC